ncbi:uncharacterized protein LOC112046880 [Bicyclus anynana]|uniref:Uncharacterized protein LOC112046880 n=1 Tax=Bicyclus anynana TaxID=110368 RepID=A0ABM3LQU0_BICAN|nr:uncharacterized protein LOC112046880 [Bicyclus anynana]
MEDQFKKEFPKGALSFYVKIYCRRKDQLGKKCKVEEAMKSWISLDKSEKEFFEKKYNEYRDTHKKRIALHLKNAEPYLQPKENIVNRNSVHSVDTSNKEIDEEINENEFMSSKIEVDDNVNEVSATKDEENTESVFHSPIPNITSPIRNTTLHVLDFDTSNKEIELATKNQHELMTSKIEVNDTVNEDSEIQDEENKELVIHSPIANINSPITNQPSENEVLFIPEPIPPKVMTSKDLFLKIKERRNGTEIWEQLTQKEKRYYRNAVASIKKNYLQQYKNYLEHLSSEELFKHHRKIINSADSKYM